MKGIPQVPFRGKFGAYWEEAITNKGGFHTKRHPPQHYRQMRPIYLRAEGKSPSAAQGCASIMKEGKAKKARRRESPAIAEPPAGERPAAKLLPGAKPLAKPLPRKRNAHTSTRARPSLKPLRKLEPHLRGAFGHPKPAPNLL